MISQFIEQIQILMQAQQIKCAENVFGKSNYMWLCSKRIPITWMSPRDEFFIRQTLSKFSEEQQVKVMKQLLTWLDNNPDVHCLQIPAMCIRLLNNTFDENLIQRSNLTRMGSIRDSFRRTFSFKRNAVDKVPQRTVTFNEEPTVYRIGK